MDAFKSLIRPLVAGAGTSSVVDGMKLVVLGGTVETARRVSSSAWSHFVNSFFLTAYFCEEDYPYDWLMLWLSRRPEWQRSREFETTTRSSGIGIDASNSFGDEDFDDLSGLPHSNTKDDVPGRVATRVIFQPTFDTTHTIYYRGHWLRVKRSRKTDGSSSEMLSISVVARSNDIFKQLVLQAKREYEAEAIHRIQIYFADSHGSWRWTDSRHKRPMISIVLNPGVKEMLLNDAKDFLKSEKWYADRGIPFRRGYLLHGVPGSGKSSLIHAIAGQLMLDIYVVSLSASWISDATLNNLMGRVPSRCILLLEDLDAAFTRNSSRENPDGKDKDKEKDAPDSQNKTGYGSRSNKLRRSDKLCDINSLSLSGLLNALDGVAAAEGRLLFATTNHLDRLDPALSRPGRMDVWIEFKNATKWQAEKLFKNFFPFLEEHSVPSRDEGSSSRSIGDSSPSTLPSTLWSIPSFPSSSIASSFSSTPLSSSSPSSPVLECPTFPQIFNADVMFTPRELERIHASMHTTKPFKSLNLSMLAKIFADGVPEEEFSVASLQGYLLRHKSQPEAAANGIVEWVKGEREMRERLKKEKEVRDAKHEKMKDAAQREATKNEIEVKEQDLAKVRQLLFGQEIQEKVMAEGNSQKSVPLESTSPPGIEGMVVEQLNDRKEEVLEGCCKKQRAHRESDDESDTDGMDLEVDH